MNTETVYLRPMTAEDTSLIVKWRNLPAVRKRFIYQKDFTIESHENWIKTMIDTGKVVQMMICIGDALEDGENTRISVNTVNATPVGSVYIRDIDTEHHKGEYGIFIGEETARGKGIGTKAASLMIQYAFCKLKLHRLYLRVFADNKAAIRSYEKAGFEREAYLKDDVCIDGVFKDIVLMAILNKEK